MGFDKARLTAAVEGALAGVIRQDGSVPPLNETETRTHLIDPVVRALGYGTLEQVRREYYLPSAGQFVDYLLSAGDRRVVVEAKPVAAALSGKDATQLVGYCAPEGIRWALLTSGLRWQVFDVEAAGNWEAKKVAETDLLAAYKERRLETALAPLAHFALETLAAGDGGLKAWAIEQRARARIDALLSDPGSRPVAALVDALRESKIDVEPADVVRLVGRCAAATQAPVAQPVSARQERAAAAPSQYLFTAVRRGSYAATQVVRWWLDAGYWGVWGTAAHRARLAAEDRCCFFAGGEVVAEAVVAGPATELVTPGDWPEPLPFEEGYYKVPLANIRWLGAPVRLSADVRSRLDAFRGKDPNRPWAWFVRTGNRVSEHDFAVLTGRDRGS